MVSSDLFPVHLTGITRFEIFVADMAVDMHQAFAALMLLLNHLPFMVAQCILITEGCLAKPACRRTARIAG